MVSFWPWRSNDLSPASFEKSLSTISTKISTSSTSLETSRQRSRRLKALWTLYTSIAYLLYAMVLFLAVGLRKAGWVELSALGGGPVLIYGIRQGLASYYGYITSRQQKHLEALHTQRDSIIKKLKDATKYDSTQQLLEKYGGTPARGKRSNNGLPQGKKGPSENKNEAANQRTGSRPTVVPPPTANIPRNDRAGLASMPNTPQRSTPITPGPNPPFTAAAATPPWERQDSSLQPHPLSQSQTPISPGPDTASFAPNAFDSYNPSHYASSTSLDAGGSRWYDRLLDVLLGEDESHPKNRLALICANCRLVNGQAPPGVKRLEDVGRWKCAGCGATNGGEADAEVGRILRGIGEEKEKARERGSERNAQGTEDDDEPVLVSRSGLDSADGEAEGDNSDVTQYSSDENAKAKSAVKIEEKPERETSKGRAKTRKSRKFEE